MYTRKTKDIFIVQGFYCGAWENLTESESRAEARADYKAYVENEKGVMHRIIKKREKIQEEKI